DVQVHVRTRAAIGRGRFLPLGEHELHATAGKRDTAPLLRVAPFLGHGPSERVAIELQRRLEIRGTNEEVVEAVARHGLSVSYCWASTTATAVMLTILRTVADGVRTCPARDAPSSIGPTVMPEPPTTFSRLNEMLAASSVGMMRRFASPF